MSVVSMIWYRVTGITWGFRWQCRLQRRRRAWRYAIDTMTAEDAGWIRHRCQAVEGFWPLEAIDAEGVLREARDRWHDHPALEHLAYDAVERIANKWSGSGDISCEARGCAIDLIAYYARTQGIELIERDNDTSHAPVQGYALPTNLGCASMPRHRAVRARLFVMQQLRLRAD